MFGCSQRMCNYVDYSLPSSTTAFMAHQQKSWKLTDLTVKIQTHNQALSIFAFEILKCCLHWNSKSRAASATSARLRQLDDSSSQAANPSNLPTPICFPHKPSEWQTIATGNVRGDFKMFTGFSLFAHHLSGYPKKRTSSGCSMAAAPSLWRLSIISSQTQELNSSSNMLMMHLLGFPSLESFPKNSVSWSGAQLSLAIAQSKSSWAQASRYYTAIRRHPLLSTSIAKAEQKLSDSTSRCWIHVPDDQSYSIPPSILFISTGARTSHWCSCNTLRTWPLSPSPESKRSNLLKFRRCIMAVECKDGLNLECREGPCTATAIFWSLIVVDCVCFMGWRNWFWFLIRRSLGVQITWAFWTIPVRFYRYRRMILSSRLIRRRGSRNTSRRSRISSVGSRKRAQIAKFRKLWWSRGGIRGRIDGIWVDWVTVWKTIERWVEARVKGTLKAVISKRSGRMIWYDSDPNIFLLFSLLPFLLNF